MKQQYKNNMVIPLIMALTFYCSGFLIEHIFISTSLLLVGFVLLILNGKKYLNVIEDYEDSVQFLQERIPVIGSARIDWEKHLDEKNDIPKPLKVGEVPKFDRNNITLLYEPKKPL